MPLPSSYEFSVDVGYLTIYFYVNDNMCVSGAYTNTFLHNHKDYEIRYFESGSSNYCVGNSVYTCHARSFLLIPPSLFHAQLREQNSSTADAVQYNLRFRIATPSKSSGINIHQATRVHDILDKMLLSPQILQDNGNLLGVYFRFLSREIYEHQPGNVTNARCLCQLIFTTLLRILSPGNNEFFPNDQLAYSASKRNAIDELFTRSFVGDVTIQTLADNMGVSVRQANRIMHTVYGKSFQARLLEMRLETSKVMLRMTNESIGTIAQRCGFKSYSNFYTQFKKYELLSPQEFRRCCREAEG